MTPFQGTRSAALAIALTASVALTSPNIAHAATPPTTTDLEISAGFLDNQLEATTNGVLTGPSGSLDYGLTQDFVFALDALGTQSDQADRSYAEILNNLDEYIYRFDEIDAARLGKVVAMEASRNQQETTRISELIESVQENGQVVNKKSDGTFSTNNNFGQAWAVIGLARAGEIETANNAADYLLSQVCPSGGVPLYQATPTECNSIDSDTTGLVAQALVLTKGTGNSGTKSTVQYLRSITNSQGAIDSLFSGPNSNSTALAASAFALVGDESSFIKAHKYIDSVRYGSEANQALQGAFAWRSKDNNLSTVNDQLRRASAQAALAYAGGNYANSEIYQPISEPPAGNGSSSESLSIIGIVAALIAVIAAVIGFLSPTLFALVPNQF